MKKEDWIITLCRWMLLVTLGSYIITSHWETKMTEFEQQQAIKIDRIDSILLKYTK